MRSARWPPATINCVKCSGTARPMIRWLLPWVKGSRMDLKILSVAALIRVFIALITKDSLLIVRRECHYADSDRWLGPFLWYPAGHNIGRRCSNSNLATCPWIQPISCSHIINALFWFRHPQSRLKKWDEIRNTLTIKPTQLHLTGAVARCHPVSKRDSDPIISVGSIWQIERDACWKHNFHKHIFLLWKDFNMCGFPSA